MSLTVMQEIFILLEDEKEVPFFRLKRWGRAARGVLSKLKNLGWAEKFQKNNEIFYRITPKGENYIDDVLSILKLKGKWDQKWRLIIFDIPENNRSVRDRLRRYLNSLGLGILQASVWISPENIKEKIDGISLKLKLGSQIKYFEVKATSQLNQQIIEKAWNLPEVNEALEKFIKEAKWSLKGMGKGNGDRFKSKKLIFEYALILKKGPKLPLEFIEQNKVRCQAHELYLELRRFAI